MAGRIIVFKNANDQIKGQSVADKYKDWLDLTNVQVSAYGYNSADGDSGTAHQSSISISLPWGPWAAEFQQALYHGKALGKVTIVEAEQRRDEQAKKVWTKIRELTLENAYVETFTHEWRNIHSTVSLTIDYQKCTLGAGDTDQKFAVIDRSDAS